MSGTDLRTREVVIQRIIVNNGDRRPDISIIAGTGKVFTISIVAESIFDNLAGIRVGISEGIGSVAIIFIAAPLSISPLRSNRNNSVPFSLTGPVY